MDLNNSLLLLCNYTNVFLAWSLFFHDLLNFLFNELMIPVKLWVQHVIALVDAVHSEDLLLIFQLTVINDSEVPYQDLKFICCFQTKHCCCIISSQTRFENKDFHMSMSNLFHFLLSVFHSGQNAFVNLLLLFTLELFLNFRRAKFFKLFFNPGIEFLKTEDIKLLQDVITHWVTTNFSHFLLCQFLLSLQSLSSFLSTTRDNIPYKSQNPNENS